MQHSIKTRSGRQIIVPTTMEDAAINAAALNDPDAQPLTASELAKLRPMRGRPPAAVKRPMLSMRVDPDVLEHLRASGKGWQTKVNALLRQAIKQGKV
jgi:uncharacterized protein (DUF4415 family)